MRLGSVMPRAARVSLAALAALTLGSTPAFPQVRLGYIDSARIWVEYKDAAEAQQRFDRQVQGWRDEATEKERAVSALRQEVRDQGPVLSGLKRREKETALQRAISEYESFVQEVWGPTGRATQENGRATEEVIQKVRVAVEKVAAKRGVDMVLDATSGFVIYADKTLDMTNEVIAELNANAAGTGAR